MGYFPRPASPRALLSDMRAYMADQGKIRLAGVAIAIGMTSIIITGFIVESRWGVLPKGPQIVYAADWTAARTDADIQRDQKIDQAERHAAQKAKQAAFQRVANTLGIE